MAQTKIVERVRPLAPMAKAVDEALEAPSERGCGPRVRSIEARRQRAQHLRDDNVRRVQFDAAAQKRLDGVCDRRGRRLRIGHTLDALDETTHMTFADAELERELAHDAAECERLTEVFNLDRGQLLVHLASKRPGV